MNLKLLSAIVDGIAPVVRNFVAEASAKAELRIKRLEEREPLKGEQGPQGEKGEPGESGQPGERGADGASIDAEALAAEILDRVMKSHDPDAQIELLAATIEKGLQ